MKLYEIDLAMEALVDPETGEVADFEAFEALAMERESKIDNLALWVKDLEAEQLALDNEARKLIERRDTARRKRDRLKAYLQEMLAGEKRSTEKYAVSYRRTESVELTDEDAAYAWLVDHGHTDGYVSVKTSVSKSGIKPLLKEGAAIPGAELVTRQSMTIR